MTLHVVKPRTPLPLDPDFFFGSIDARTLVARGYADAARYLDTRRPGGVPFTPEATLLHAGRLALEV